MGARAPPGPPAVPRPTGRVHGRCPGTSRTSPAAARPAIQRYYRHRWTAALCSLSMTTHARIGELARLPDCHAGDLRQGLLSVRGDDGVALESVAGLSGG